MTTGKCKRCKVIYRWKAAILLKDACCVHCHAPLERHARMIGKASLKHPCGSNECGYTHTCAEPYAHYMLPENLRLRFNPLFGVPVEVFRG